MLPWLYSLVGIGQETGNNVSLGANVTIIGPVHVGNNITVAAGAVVVKEVPHNQHLG